MKKVQLAKPHIHGGVTYGVGDVLLVSDADAAYLIKHHIGTAVKDNKPVTAPHITTYRASESTDAAENNRQEAEQATNTDINTEGEQ